MCVRTDKQIVIFNSLNITEFHGQEYRCGEWPSENNLPVIYYLWVFVNTSFRVFMDHFDTQ